MGDASPTQPSGGLWARGVALFTHFWAKPSIRYLAVGGTAYVVDFGLLTLCYEVFNWNVAVATNIGFWCSFAVNYTGQRLVSFQGRANMGASFVKYCVLVAFNAGVNTLVVALFAQLGWAGSFMVGKVVVTIAQTVWNYQLYKHWVFKAPALAALAPSQGETVAWDAPPADRRDAAHETDATPR